MHAEFTLLFQKLERRKAAVKAGTWNTSQQKKIRDVLLKEFTSPDASDGESQACYRLPFKWESSMLAKEKIALDNIYREQCLLPHSRKRLFPAVDHPTSEVTTTPPPKHAPDWIISKSYYMYKQ